MEHPKLAVAGCVGLVVLGFALGATQAPPAPEAPLPEVIVKTVTKTETVTKEVPSKLPEDCVEAIAMMHTLGDDLGEIDRAAGDIKLQTYDMNKYSVMREVNKMVGVIEAQNDSVHAMDEAVVAKTDLIRQIDLALMACEDSMP